MENVTTILARKQAHFNKISPNCSVSDALCRMSGQHTEYLIVLDDDENFLGILTEHEIATKTIFTNHSISKTTVKEIMNTNLPVADAGHTVEGCMQLMRRFNVRYIPVFDNLNFLGVISTDDILQEAVSNRTAIFDKEDKTVSVAYSY